MTILTIVQDVADESQLFERPATLVENLNRETRQALSFLKTISEEYVKYHDWQGLQKEQTFTTDGSESYAFSTIVTDGDFDRTVTETEWDRTNEKKVRIYTAAEWQELVSGIIATTGINRYARARGDSLIITPDASGDTLVFEYISKFYAVSSGGTAKATYTADDDTSKVPEPLLKRGLKYYIKSEQGIPAEEDMHRYYDYMDDLAGQDQPAKVIRGSRQRSDFVINIPDTGAGT